MTDGPGGAKAVRRRPPRRAVPTRTPGPPVIITIRALGDPVPYDVRFFRGHAVIPKRVREWKGNVRFAALHAIAAANAAYFAFSVRCHYDFALKRPKTVPRTLPSVRPDLTSLVRPAEDALTGIVWVDDSQVCEVRAQKRYVREGEAPGVTITVEEIVE
jgi:Holliday junction resolvase RusA-like endonuclease